MVKDRVSVYTVKPSLRSEYPADLHFIMFSDGEPIVTGKTYLDVLEPLVEGEFTDNVVPMTDSNLTESDLRSDSHKVGGDYQEVDVGEQLSDTRVESMMTGMGFQHGEGCGEILVTGKTIAKNMAKETATGTVLFILGNVTGYKYAADAIAHISSASNFRQESVMEWCDHIEMRSGNPTCTHCGKEVKV